MRVLPVLLMLAATPAAAATWVADPAASKLGFSGVQTGTPFSGGFKKFTATIAFDPDKPDAGSIDAVIDLASASTGDTQRDQALPQAEWFDVKSFPTASFKAAGFKATGNDSYETHGKLTVRGVTVDVTLPFTLVVSGDNAHAKGHADLVRSKFGVGQGAWTTGEYVALEVGVDLDVVAKKQP